MYIILKGKVAQL